jgi:predicted nuclease of predicted toxin-antitoxin system
VKLLLDAHLSVRGIAQPLRSDGHDVLALAEHSELDGLADAQVLEFAAEQERILVTRNAKDFAPLLRDWAEAGTPHHGCILIWSLRHDQFGPILEGVREALSRHPRSADWTDLALAV